MALSLTYRFIDNAILLSYNSDIKPQRRNSMGDIGIIARRVAEGKVKYGWNWNGGYFSTVL